MQSRSGRPAAFVSLVLSLVAACTSTPAPADGGSIGPAWPDHVYAGGGSTIHVFALDRATGALGFRAAVPAGDRGYLVDVDVRRRRVYLQTQLGLPVVIRAYEVGPDGLLRVIADHLLEHPFVEGMTEVLLDPSGSWLLMSSTGGATGLLDQLAPVRADGTLGPARTISSEFYGFAWDPSGQHLFGLDGVSILQYRFDGAAGTIAANDPPSAAGSLGHQVLWLRTHPNGRWVYAVEEGAVGVFAFDPARGTLVGQGYARNPVPGDAVVWSSIAVHPDGRHLYAVGNVAGTLQALVDLFAIDPGTGNLTFVRREKTAGRHQLRLGSLQAPLLIGDFLVIGGEGVEAPIAGLPALGVYRIGADGTLAATGDPVPLQPASGTEVNFVFAVPGGP